jgi:hypothetical protein
MSSAKAIAGLDDVASTAVKYQPSFEKADEHEAQTNAVLIETITKIQKKVSDDSGHAARGVHAKCHGVLIGEMRILAGLPPVLAQGLFSKFATYPVVMRLSTIPGDILDDNISVPRGLAIKVVGVSGARVSGSEGDVTQDFVCANGPVFANAEPHSFSSILKLLAGTTDRAPGLKKALSAVMRGAEQLVESVGGESATMMTLGGYPEVHILGDEFYSQAPILYGDYMAKIAVKPFSAGLRALSKMPLELKYRPNGIREAVADFFRSNGGEWDLQVQLCTDIETMPLEDASKKWPENLSPYLSVARIHIPAQDPWSATRIAAVDEGMAFSPWHALAAHRPLGAIMRVRKTVYDTAARFRAEHNLTKIAEPRLPEDLPR